MEKKPTVNLKTLCLPIQKGGVKLLNLKARNQAIEIMWLKSYLDLGPKRPMWAYVADVLISENVSKSSGAVTSLAQINTYLQSWSPGLHSSSKLPIDILRMMKTGQHFKVSFEALKLSDSLKGQLPAWYHIGVNHHLTSMNNHKYSKCLRENHLVKTVADLIQNTKRGQGGNTQQHFNRSNCACRCCKEDRLNFGCKAPNKCYRTAIMLLDQLHAKWHPNNQPPMDNLTHTPNRWQANAVAHKNNDPIYFDPSITSDDSLAHNFRIFTDPSAKCVDPAYRKHPLVATDDEAMEIYITGACSKNSYEDAQAGSGIWYGQNDQFNAALHIPGPNQSRQVGDLSAVLHAVQQTPPFAPLHIISNSKYVIKGLTERLTKWEEQGWIGIPNKEFLKPIVAHLRQRGAITTFAWAKGHNGAVGIRNAMALAKQGVNKQAYDQINLDINPKFNLTGAQLSCLSQATAYQGILGMANPVVRCTTTINLDITRYAVQASTGHLPTDAMIWYSIRTKDISRTIRVFLWKLLHGTHKCGEYWNNIPNFEHRAICQICGMEDSMSHILTECTAPGQREIWALAKNVWMQKHKFWSGPKSLGDIAGCCLSTFCNNKGHPKPGTNRLYRIIISESAYLIWKVRCERVIERNCKELWHTPQELYNRLQHTLNRQLELDRAMTDKKFAKKALSEEKVLNTWSGILKDEYSLPDNWIKHPGVLVGIRPLEQLWWQHDPP
jgi:ribonuclease HI